MADSKIVLADALALEKAIRVTQQAGQSLTEQITGGLAIALGNVGKDFGKVTTEAAKATTLMEGFKNKFKEDWGTPAIGKALARIIDPMLLVEGKSVVVNKAFAALGTVGSAAFNGIATQAMPAP